MAPHIGGDVFSKNRIQHGEFNAYPASDIFLWGSLSSEGSPKGGPHRRIMVPFYRAPTSLEMTIRCTSDVPSPISKSF